MCVCVCVCVLVHLACSPSTRVHVYIAHIPQGYVCVCFWTHCSSMKTCQTYHLLKDTFQPASWCRLYLLGQVSRQRWPGSDLSRQAKGAAAAPSPAVTARIPSCTCSWHIRKPLRLPCGLYYTPSLHQNLPIRGSMPINRKIPVHPQN